MRNRILWLAGLLVVLALVVSCGGAAPTTAPAKTTAAPPATTAAPKTAAATTAPASSAAPKTTAAKLPPNQWGWPKEISIATSSATGSDTLTANGFAPVMEKSTGMKVRIVPVSVSASRFYDSLTGVDDFSMMSLADVGKWYRGVGGSAAFEKPGSAIVFMAYDNPYAYYTAGNTDIKTIYDLKKKKGYKLGSTPANAGVYVEMHQAIPAFLGMTPEEANSWFQYVEFGSWDAFQRSAIEGKSDVAYTCAPAAVAVEIESNPVGLRILDLPATDAEGWKRYMSYEGLNYPGKCTMGIKTAMGRDVVIQPKVILARTSQDQDLVYKVTKWLMEYNADYKDTYMTCPRMTKEVTRQFLDMDGFPIAQGSVKYFKEIGIWTAADDVWNNQATELMNKYVKASADAFAAAKAKGIKIDMESKEWLALYNSFIKDLPAFTNRVSSK